MHGGGAALARDNVGKGGTEDVGGDSISIGYAVPYVDFTGGTSSIGRRRCNHVFATCGSRPGGDIVRECMEANDILFDHFSG